MLLAGRRWPLTPESTINPRLNDPDECKVSLSTRACTQEENPCTLEWPEGLLYTCAGATNSAWMSWFVKVTLCISTASQHCHGPTSPHHLQLLQIHRSHVDLFTLENTQELRGDKTMTTPPIRVVKLGIPAVFHGASSLAAGSSPRECGLPPRHLCTDWLRPVKQRSTRGLFGFKTRTSRIHCLWNSQGFRTNPAYSPNPGVCEWDSTGGKVQLHVLHGYFHPHTPACAFPMIFVGIGVYKSNNNKLSLLETKN